MVFSHSMTPIIREDVADVARFILESGLCEAQHLPHTPFLVQHEGQIVLVDNAQQLLEFPDDTVVMGQWPGTYRSDYFRFTVQVYKDYREAGLIGEKGCSFQEIQATLIRRKEETERQVERLRRGNIWQQLHAILAEGKYICVACDWCGVTPETVEEQKEGEITKTHICPACHCHRLYAPQGGWSTMSIYEKTKKPQISVSYVPFNNEADREWRYRLYAQSVVSALQKKVREQT